MRTKDAIATFLNSCRARNLKPSTIRWYSQRLAVFDRCYPELPEDITTLETFLAGIDGTPENKHAYFRVLRAFYRFISPRYQIANPMSMTDTLEPRRSKKVMSTLEPDEALKFLASAETMRDKALFTLMLDSGIRTTEAATLLQRNIFTETVIVNGKCGEHEVPITEETRRLLIALIAQDGPHKYVFHNPQGGPLSRHTIYKLVRHHMKKAGIDGPKMGGHRLRHTFGRFYLATGGDTRSLQEILGHSDITTTEKYSSLNMKDIIKKHHQHTPLKLVHGAAQGVLIADELIREVEAILIKQPETGGANKQKQIGFF